MAKSINDKLNDAIDKIRDLKESNKKMHYELAMIYRSVNNYEKADLHQKKADEIQI